MNIKFKFEIGERLVKIVQSTGGYIQLIPMIPTNIIVRSKELKIEYWQDDQIMGKDENLVSYHQDQYPEEVCVMLEEYFERFDRNHYEC